MTVRRRRPYDVVKRALDLVVSGVGLLLIGWLLLLVALLIRVRLGSPVLFRQERPGRDGEVFRIMKFRTMLEHDAARGLVTDEQRLTPFGAALRRTSIDELPALLNVFAGDMSFVGPRPLLVEYLPLYSPEQARRHEVRPGITGLAQVNGRNALGWEDRFAFDVEYVDNRSLLLDARILARTVGIVLKREGISAEGHATVAPFTGSREQGAGE